MRRRRQLDAAEQEKDRATVEALVEIPRGSRSKYELDEASGRLRLDRVLPSSIHYPTDYGFILDTLSEDGDHLDVLVMTEEPALPGSVQAVRPVGLLDMSDEKGRDVKVLAVPTGDARFDQVRDLEDVAPHWRLEIETFFKTYKLLDDKASPSVRGWRQVRFAWSAIEKAKKAYQARQGGARRRRGR